MRHLRRHLATRSRHRCRHRRRLHFFREPGIPRPAAPAGNKFAAKPDLPVYIAGARPFYWNATAGANSRTRGVGADSQQWSDILRRLGLFCILLLVCATAPAQDALRSSLAGEQAAAVRKRNRTDTYYNLDLDPVKLRFNSSLAAEYNDNVNLNDRRPAEDFILRPQLGLRAFWQVSQRNSLDVALNLGYEYYFNEARPSRVIVSGDENSGLFFDLFIGDFAINLHESFSLSQDTSQDPSVSGIADIFRLENTAGTTVTWDLYKLLLQFNYDHYNYIPLDNFYQYLEHASELGSIRVSALVHPTLTLGLELGGGLTTYDDPRLSDHQHVSVGPFAKYKLSDAIDVRASTGFTYYWFEASSFITNSTSQSGLYADVTIDHVATQRTRQTLNFGQSLSTDINSSPIELFYIRYYATLNIIQHWSFQPRLMFESGNETRGLIQDNFTRYGVGLSVGRRVTQKLTSSLTYDRLVKNSDRTNFDYTQNRLVLNLLYQF